MSSQRAARVGEAMREEISKMLQKEIKDPRIGFVTVTGIDVTNDLRHARVNVSIMGNDEVVKESLKGLQSSAGFIRNELGRRIQLRYTPELTFRHDTSLEKGARITELLHSIEATKRANEEGKGNDNE